MEEKKRKRLTLEVKQFIVQGKARKTKASRKIKTPIFLDLKIKNNI